MHVHAHQYTSSIHKNNNSIGCKTHLACTLPACTSQISHTHSIIPQGMDFTTDKLRSMVKKWQTLIEAAVDVKTTDGYFLRMFCIAFTKKRAKQVKKTCYAQSSQIRQIRKKMFEIITKESTSCDLKDLVGKFIPESIGAL